LRRNDRPRHAQCVKKQSSLARAQAEIIGHAGPCGRIVSLSLPPQGITNTRVRAIGQPSRPIVRRVRHVIAPRRRPTECCDKNRGTVRARNLIPQASANYLPAYAAERAASARTSRRQCVPLHDGRAGRAQPESVACSSGSQPMRVFSKEEAPPALRCARPRRFSWKPPFRNYRFQSLRTLSPLWRPQRAVKGQALDCALGRPPRRRACRGATARDRSTLLALTNLRMPNCAKCLHRGRDHNWKVPPCAQRTCACLLDHPKRLRGRCLVPGCHCWHYCPLTEWPKPPVNKYIGRARR